MEEALPIKNPPPPAPKRRRRCLYASLCCLATTVVIFLVLLTIALTLFKPKDPRLTLASIALTGVSPSLEIATLRLSLNLSLHLQISVYNPNRVSFSHDAGSTDIFYRGGRVGNALIAEGTIPSRGSALVDLDVAIQSGNFTNRIGDLAGDLLAGQMAFESSSRVPGRVKILGIVRKHVDAYSDCRVVIGLPSLAVKEQECSQRTKL